MKRRFFSWFRRLFRRPARPRPNWAVSDLLDRLAALGVVERSCADRPVDLTPSYQRLARAMESLPKQPEPPAEPIDGGS
jgi:hypothetical protein